MLLLYYRNNSKVYQNEMLDSADRLFADVNSAVPDSSGAGAGIGDLADQGKADQLRRFKADMLFFSGQQRLVRTNGAAPLDSEWRGFR